jgi:cyclopropane-fatty-acyl-phospholipid synthase
MLLRYLLRHLIRVGTLTVIDAAGGTHVFRGREGPRATIRLHRRSLQWTLFFQPSLRLGEAYTDGTLTVEDGSLYDFLDLVGRNWAIAGAHPLEAWGERGRNLIRRLREFNSPARARRNAAHHYDLTEELYRLFLDSDLQYSCAYFLDEDESLEAAQANKRRHIAAKLLLRPGQKVLDIGSGWGGLALHLAAEAGVEVTGITLSEMQLEASRRRAKESGLSDRVSFHLRDYRKQEGTFDRIVSVGMFEHVGVGYYRTFFDKIRDLLAEDGVALLHTIGRSGGPCATDPWLRRYIFPGGSLPALSEIMPAVERSGLWTADVEVLRLHYATTLRRWRERFLASRERAKALYDERFARMWEFYLAASEISFRYLGNAVFQVQMARRQDAVPLTRDYIGEWERAPAARDVAGGQRAA